MVMYRTGPNPSATPCDTSRPTRPTVVETDRPTTTRTQPLAGVDTGTSRPNPRRRSRPWTTPHVRADSATHRHVNHNFRRNDLRRTHLSPVSAETKVFLNVFLSTINLRAQCTQGDLLNSLQFRLTTHCWTSAGELLTDPVSTAGSDEAERGSVIFNYNNSTLKIGHPTTENKGRSGRPWQFIIKLTIIIGRFVEIITFLTLFSFQVTYSTFHIYGQDHCTAQQCWYDIYRRFISMIYIRYLQRKYHIRYISDFSLM